MLPVIQVKPSGRETIQFWKDQPGKFVDAVEPAMRRAAEFLVGAVKASQFRGSPLQTRTGQLVKAVDWRVRRLGNSVVAQIGVIRGPALSYARIHEEGGVIKPKKGRALAVPLAGAKESTIPLTPKEAQDKYPDMFMLKRPGKPPLLVRPLRVRGGGSRAKGMILMFALVPKVRIKPKFWLSGGVRKNLSVWEVEFESEMARRLAG